MARPRIRKCDPAPPPLPEGDHLEAHALALQLALIVAREGKAGTQAYALAHQFLQLVRDKLAAATHAIR